MSDVISSDGVYARSEIFQNIADDTDPIVAELRAVLAEFAGRDILMAELGRVTRQMMEFGIDYTSPDGQRKAAFVLRNRLSAKPSRWLDMTTEALERRAAIERSAGTHFVYYVDLWGSAVKIGYSGNILNRLVDLRRTMSHVLALEPGGRSVEGLRHLQFADERDGALEDFARSPRLLAHIADICATHGDPSDLLAEAGRARPA